MAVSIFHFDTTAVLSCLSVSLAPTLENPVPGWQVQGFTLPSIESLSSITQVQFILCKVQKNHRSSVDLLYQPVAGCTNERNKEDTRCCSASFMAQPTLPKLGASAIATDYTSSTFVNRPAPVALPPSSPYMYHPTRKRTCEVLKAF
ncbi:hypothetical protein PGT21_022967 [Puccinia graminis f. sp. tritici]|uniref:Uncharacterized protein n=1 Tax=Puccinia graminis f. sp. tritici TaxID=56615 RepID=A0A5B0R1G4_PUCGR|nr:hypothetical protein PGT21_022967 [Puccinia graminis f. sp. tritici]